MEVARWFTWGQRSVGLLVYLIIATVFQSLAYSFLLGTLYLLFSTSKYEIFHQRSESLVRFSFFLFCLGCLQDLSRFGHFGTASFLGGLVGWTFLLFVYGRQIYHHLSHSSASSIELLFDPMVMDRLQRIWGFLLLGFCILFAPYYVDDLIFGCKLYCFLSTIKYLLRKQYTDGYIRLAFVMLPIASTTNSGFHANGQDWLQVVFCLCFFGFAGYLDWEK